MKNLSTLLTATAICFAGLSAPAFAESGKRVLKISPGLCDGFKASLVDWAQTVTEIGAYALPVAPASLGYSCDNPGPSVPAGQSFGFDRVRPAEAAALEYCNANKPEDFLPCVVVARTYPGK